MILVIALFLPGTIFLIWIVGSMAMGMHHGTGVPPVSNTLPDESDED